MVFILFINDIINFLKKKQIKLLTYLYFCNNMNYGARIGVRCLLRNMKHPESCV